MTQEEYSKAQEQYSKVCNEFSNGTICRLLAALDVAFWERVNTSGEDVPAAYRNRPEDVLPKSLKEIAVWEELTSPCNFVELKKYVEAFAPLLDETERCDYGRNLHGALLERATRRAAAGTSGE